MSVAAALLRAPARARFHDATSSDVVGPTRNCARCGVPVRDADVRELKNVVKVLDRPHAFITEDGEVAVGYDIHDEVVCEKVAAGERIAVVSGL